MTMHAQYYKNSIKFNAVIIFTKYINIYMNAMRKCYKKKEYKNVDHQCLNCGLRIKYGLSE